MLIIRKLYTKKSFWFSYIFSERCEIFVYHEKNNFSIQLKFLARGGAIEQHKKFSTILK